MKFLFVLAMVSCLATISNGEENLSVDSTNQELLNRRLNRLQGEVNLLKHELELQEKFNDRIFQIIQNFGGAFLVLILALIGLNIYNNRNIAKETAKDEVEKLNEKFKENLKEIVEKNQESSLFLETLKRAYSVINRDDNKEKNKA